MKTPAFWYQPPGLPARLLQPAAWLWQQGTALRRALAKPHKLPVPLIVVGNAVAGGAGKTPVTLALTHHLRAEGLRIHLIAKGYGGRLEGPVRVDPVFHTAADVGDEALLLAGEAPTWIGHDRAATATAAAIGADLVISDDGLQNPSLRPDLTLLVLDGAAGLGNGLVMPAGPLREPFADVLARTGAIVQIGGPPCTYGKLVLDAKLRPLDGNRYANQKVLAFAGLARPEKFFTTLENTGARVVERIAFADHHPYTEKEVQKILHTAADKKATPITTTKDAVRLPPHLRSEIRVLETRLEWTDPRALDALLAPLLPPPPAHTHPHR